MSGFSVATPSGEYIPLGGFIFQHRGGRATSVTGRIIKFSVSFAAVATSLLAISWIGLALLGF
jgi:hypothetical protein